MLTLMHGLEYSWVLGSASLGTVTKFPFGSVVEVRFLEGALSLKDSSRKAFSPGGEDLEVPFPHSTRSPQLGSEWSWLGNPAKTFRNPSEPLWRWFTVYWYGCLGVRLDLHYICSHWVLESDVQYWTLGGTFSSRVSNCQMFVLKQHSSKVHMIEDLPHIGWYLKSNDYKFLNDGCLI